MEDIRHADLVRDQLARPPFGTYRREDAPWPVRVGIAGSGEQLLVLTWSAEALAHERQLGVQLLRRLGVESGVRVANTLPGALATPGSLLLGDVIEELGALDVPLGETDGAPAARAAWDLVDRVEPEVLVVDEATSGTLLAARPPGARPWWRGIVWLRRGGQRPDVPDFAGWQREWLAVPEVTSFAAGSCAANRFHPSAGVDAVVTGGVLVLTSFGADARPFRYASDLRVRAESACPCGMRGLAFTLREGRT